MHKTLFSLVLIAVTLLAVPAAASAGAQVPEASSLTLFALGVLGVLIGRHGVTRARIREERNDEKEK